MILQGKKYQLLGGSALTVMLRSILTGWFAPTASSVCGNLVLVVIEGSWLVRFIALFVAIMGRRGRHEESSKSKEPSSRASDR